MATLTAGSRLGRYQIRAPVGAGAVAALSHPHILAIHDFGGDGDTAYAVMELLEGQTLRERIADGPLPVRKAIDIALQIARGLDAAHQKGICVQPFPSGAGGWQVSLSGAGARWSAADPDGSVPGITVVQNWFAEFVKKR